MTDSVGRSIRVRQENPGPDPKDIEEIASSAQVAWFGLLGFLAFYAVVMLTTDDADFIVDTKQTALPLVGISISTSMFYFTAPVVTLALYLYLHHLCFILWGQSHHACNRRQLESALSASLIGTIVLTLKRGTRPHGHGDLPFILRYAAAVLAGALIWCAAPAVLVFSLAASDSASDLPVLAWLTVRWVTWFCFVATAAVGTASLFWAVRVGFGRGLFRNLILAATCMGAVGLAVWAGYWQWVRPGEVHVAQTTLPKLPAAWTDARERRETYRRDWCAGADLPLGVCAVRVTQDGWDDIVESREAYCETVLRSRSKDWCRNRFAGWDGRFATDWGLVRTGELATVPRVNIRGRTLAGLSADGVRAPRIIANGATLDGSKLSNANLEGGDFLGSGLRGVDGQYATFDRANLTGANLSGANLPTSSFEQAKLSGAVLIGASFVNAGLEGADFGKGWRETERASVPADLRLANLSNAPCSGPT